MPRKARSKKTDPISVKPSKKRYAGPILVLKTTKAGGEPHCNGCGGIKTDFRWPRSGHVMCPDWGPTPKCGGGFHGLEFGEGSWDLLKTGETPADEWRVVLVRPADVVRLTDNGQTKIKFSSGEIVYCGDMASAITYVMCRPEAMERAAILAAKPSSGYNSTSASSGDYSTSEQIGSGGIASAIGIGVRGKAGENGLIVLTWWDAAAKRFHACVGEVGIDGIESDTWYEVKDGKLSKVQS